MASKKKPAAKPKAAAKTSAKKAPAKKAKPAPAAPPSGIGELRLLDIKSMVPDPKNRQDTTHQDLEELAASIKAHGVLQPICVRPHPGEHKYATLMIVWGERRWRAAQLAGLATIPAIVRTFPSDEAVILAQAIENLQRKDLNGIEVAKQLARLRDDVGLKVTQIPEKLTECGLKEMSRSYVSNTLRLLELPAWAQDYIRSGRLTPKHGLVMLQAVDLPKVMDGLKAIVDRNLKNTQEPFTSGDLQLGLTRAFRAIYPDANERWGADPVLYDWKKHQDELGVRIVSLDNGWKHVFVTNISLHEQLQKEAKEKAQAAEERRRAKAAAAEKKAAGGGEEQTEQAPKAARVSDQTLREHLHAWLRATLLADLFGTEPAVLDNAGLHRALASWAALGAPNCDFSHDNAPIAGAGRQVLERQSCIDLLAVLEADVLKQDAIALQAARNAVQHMSLPSTVALAHHLRLDLDRYRITEESLRMFTNTGLDELADIAGDPAIKAAKKAVNKRLDLMKHAETIGMPTLLRALYDEELQQIREHQQEFAERGPICEHCGEYDCEDTCPGAMAARGKSDDEAEDEAEAAEEAEA